MAKRKTPAKTATRRPSRGGGSSRSKAGRSAPGTKPAKGSARAGLTAQEKRYAAYKQRHGIKGELTQEQRRRARGHKPDEHKERERRARAAGRLTERERNAIRRHAAKLAKRLDQDTDDLANDMLAFFGREGGSEKWVIFKSGYDRLRGNRSNFRWRTRKDGTLYAVGDMHANQQNVAFMDELSDELEVPREWLYYN